MADISGGANRIELESQILCSALRLSWADVEEPGVFLSTCQLNVLFPDLLPPPRPNSETPKDLYELLQLRCDVPQSMVVAGYFRAVRKFLRENNPKDTRDEYFQVLNAGFILRKPRLRLSHDLVVGRQWLIEHKFIPEDGTLERIEDVAERAEREPEPSQMVRTQPIQESLPMLIELLKYAQIIQPAEVQALSNQMSIAPEVPVIELILQAGYVTEQEMKSLQLAEYLLMQEKITMPQFAVAMYDERTQGIRMAESLQVRGWLETQSRPYEDKKNDDKNNDSKK
jgi:hypothetical protein